MQLQEIVFQHPEQVFAFDPPDGRPAASPAPKVVVRDGNRVVAATTGVCTIDPVDTRLHGDACAGSKRIGVVSSAGIVPGGRYLMTKPEGDREWIEVVAIRDGTLVLRHPLIHRYAGNATIVGCRISVAVAPEWSATLANLSDRGRACGLARYVLRWTYAVDDHEMAGVSFAELVTARCDQLVTPTDLEKRFPGSTGGDDYISEAFRVVRLEAVGDDHAQRKLRNADVIRELVGMRASVIRLEHEVMHGAPRGEELAVAERRYRASYARLVVGRHAQRFAPIAASAPRYAAARVEPPEPAPEPAPARPLKRTEPGAQRTIPKLT